MVGSVTLCFHELCSDRCSSDSPTLDTRLTFIRRQSGLDSRAALFVLSPVSPSELAEFTQRSVVLCNLHSNGKLNSLPVSCNSLQQALYEPAIEYYVSHSKRVRRKRNRHSQPSHVSLLCYFYLRNFLLIMIVGFPGREYPTTCT